MSLLALTLSKLIIRSLSILVTIAVTVAVNYPKELQFQAALTFGLLPKVKYLPL